MIKQFECRKQNFICTERAKILKIRFFFSIFDFRSSDYLNWKSVRKWPKIYIFIEIYEASCEKPIIFHFVRFLNRSQEEIGKKARSHFSVSFSVWWKKRLSISRIIGRRLLQKVLAVIKKLTWVGLSK